MTSPRVYFEATGEEREVKRGCRRCYYPVWFDPEEDNVDLVSPAGIVHRGRDYGWTRCGKDATGPEWWWRL